MNKTSPSISFESEEFDNEPAAASLPSVASSALRIMKRVAPFVASAVLGAATTILLRRR